MTNKPTELVVTQALLPCPFCGNRAIIETFQSGLKQVSCSDDDASSCLAAITWGSFATEAEAIAAWNTRLASTAPASEDEVLVLAKAISGHGHRWNDILPQARKMWMRSARRGLAALHPRSEREEIANWLREDAPQWGHEALADAIERGDFKESGE